MWLISVLSFCNIVYGPESSLILVTYHRSSGRWTKIFKGLIRTHQTVPVRCSLCPSSHHHHHLHCLLLVCEEKLLVMLLWTFKRAKIQQYLQKTKCYIWDWVTVCCKKNKNKKKTLRTRLTLKQQHPATDSGSAYKEHNSWMCRNNWTLHSVAMTLPRL